MVTDRAIEETDLGFRVVANYIHTLYGYQRLSSELQVRFKVRFQVSDGSKVERESERSDEVDPMK